MPKWHSLSSRWIVAVCLAIIFSSIFVCATPVIAQEWVKLFEDTFESGDLTPWQIQSKGGGKAWIREEPSGNRFLECVPTVVCFAGDLSWTDYVLKAKLYLVNGSADLRVRQSSTAYVVQVTEGKCSLWKVKEGPDYKIWELASTPAPIKLNTWYWLGISCQGNNLYVALWDSHPSTGNEPPLSELKYYDKQDPISYGNIGLGVGTFDSSSHARFDDVFVSKEAAPATKPAPAASSASPSPTPATSPTMPTTQLPQPSASSLPVGTVAAIVSASVAVCSFAAYLVARRTQNRQKRHLKKLLDELDVVYTRFKMNAHRCEAELYRLKDIIATDLKEGRLEEQSYTILDKRLDGYMTEIQERIIDESLGSFPARLKDALRQLMEKGEMDENQLAALEKIILATNEVSEADKVRLRESLERWRNDYLKKGKPSQPNL